MDISQLVFARNDTNVTPDTGLTAGSSTISSAGPQAPQRSCDRQAGAPRHGRDTARRSRVGQLSVEQGRRLGGGKTVTLRPADRRQALQRRRWRRRASTRRCAVEADQLVQARRNLTGRRGSTFPPRSPARTSTSTTSGCPGCCTAGSCGPRGQGAYGDGTRAGDSLGRRELDQRTSRTCKVVQRSNFLGVVAPKEYDAIQAAAQLKVKWAPMPPVSGSGNMWKQMRDVRQPPARHPRGSRPLPATSTPRFASAAKTVTASYTHHYNGHMPIGPACAVGAM